MAAKVCGLVTIGLLAVSIPLPAWAEDYRATHGRCEVTISFPEGTKKRSDDPAAHAATYGFVILDQKTMTPKLDIDWIITSMAGVPPNHEAAQDFCRELLRKTQLKIPEERLQALRVLPLDQMNADFLVYWPPYYKFDTGSEKSSFMIYKPTLLAHRSGTLMVAIQLLGLLPFKGATSDDLQIAENVMDQMLAAAIHNATVRCEPESAP